MEKETFIITGFADEIDPSLDVQLAALGTLGIHYIEPRVVDGKNITTLFDEEVAVMKEKLAKAGVKVSSIGSPLGKVKLTDDAAAHFEKFKRTVEIAKMLDCRYIRLFSFFAGNDEADGLTDEVVARLADMVAYAEKEDVVLLHENEKGIYGNIARRCKVLFDRIPSDHFKAVFDFSNFVECRQDTLVAYELLKEHIAYVHIKDCVWGGDVAPIGMGDGHAKEILTALAGTGFHGFVSLEPHLTKYTLPDEKTCGELAMRFEDGAPRKFAYAAKVLRDLIAAIGA